MTDKWNLIVDIDRCNGCYNCALVAKDEYVGNAVAGYFEAAPRHQSAWVDVTLHERGQYPAVDVVYVPKMCNHCDEPPCMRGARDGAVTKRADGIVIIDPDKSRGQRQIAEACPYGAAHWNGDLQIVQHWPFDAHLLDRGWAAPRAVEVCATGAITAVKCGDSTMRARVESEGLQNLHPEYGTAPRIWYRNLQRVMSEFVAGVVVQSRDGVVECAAGATVKISREGVDIATAATDAFGDFRIDGLSRNSGPYRIDVALDGAKACAMVETLETSVFVGKLTLS